MLQRVLQHLLFEGGESCNLQSQAAFDLNQDRQAVSLLGHV